MTDDPEDDGDTPIPEIRQAMEEAPLRPGMDRSILERLERRTTVTWFMELFIVVFGWVLMNHLDFVRELGADQSQGKGENKWGKPD